MRYCVYRQWHDSLLQDVVEYFYTEQEAKDYALKIARSKYYIVMVGEFV
jgi:cell division protein FtsB